MPKRNVPDPYMKPDPRNYAELEYPLTQRLPTPGRAGLMWGTYMKNDNKGRPEEDEFLLPNLVAGILWDFDGWRRTAAGQQYTRRVREESQVMAHQIVPSIPTEQRVVTQAVKPLQRARRRLQKHAAAKKTTQTRKSKARPRSG